MHLLEALSCTCVLVETVHDDGLVQDDDAGLDQEHGDIEEEHEEYIEFQDTEVIFILVSTVLSL